MTILNLTQHRAGAREQGGETAAKEDLEGASFVGIPESSHIIEGSQ